MGGGNKGSFFNPTNLLTGGVIYGITELAKNMKPDKPPTPVAPPVPTGPPVSIENPDETQDAKRRKLSALQYGFASTMTNADKNLNPAPLTAPSAGKTKLGQ